MGRRLHGLILVGALGGCGRLDFATVTDGPPACTPRLANNFDDASSARWALFHDPGVVLTEASNSLAIALLDQGYGYGGVQLTGTVDLTSVGFQVECLELPDQDKHAEMFLEVHDDVWRAALGVNNHEMIYLEEQRDHTMTVSNGVVHDPASERFWRIAIVGATVVYETSADGAIWSQIGSFANHLDPTNLAVVMYAGTYDEQSMPGVARYAGAHTSDCP